MRTHSIITRSITHLAFSSQGASLLENVSTFQIQATHSFRYLLILLLFLTLLVAVRLTLANQVLLLVGVILLSIATIVGIVLIVVNVRTHKGNLVSLHYTLYYVYPISSRIKVISDCASGRVYCGSSLHSAVGGSGTPSRTTEK